MPTHSLLAVQTLDHNLLVYDPETGRAQPLTRPLPAGGWGAKVASKDVWLRPTWAPGGQRLAALVLQSSDDQVGPARVVTLDLDGVQQTEWCSLNNQRPLYLQWHPHEAALCLLSQQGSQLVLYLLRPDRLGQAHPIESGAPLFFQWSPSGARLAVHRGAPGAPEGQLLLRDPLGTAEDVVMEQPPGSFCTPVFFGEDVAFAARQAGHISDLLHASNDGHASAPLLTRAGLMAFLPRPGHAQLAVGVAPRGEGTPYEGIDLVDLATGDVTPLTSTTCLAFFWLPDGARLLLAQVDPIDNCIKWLLLALDGAPPVTIASFWPTRELLFHLHFFEQHSLSHPLLSADGAWLTYAGYPAAGGHADLSGSPKVYLKSLRDLSAPAEALGDGTFAVFPPWGRV